MSSHPNRNWRRRAIDAYRVWRETEYGRLLANIPGWPMSMEERLKGAYLDGYSAGRNDAKSK